MPDQVARPRRGEEEAPISKLGVAETIVFSGLSIAAWVPRQRHRPLLVGSRMLLWALLGLAALLARST